ncbi:Cytochrome P450 87A3 [Camellia lanceoleosa]|uniref:Cytochrome P450 87A3 n=1 Tax=Camellia lanceoleosa TaxID=1840588 RepID=A0ACC0IH53_9ERIC|nr:Cytochrome P450 87A3 [Camellia lanceoleosa]
MLACAFLRSKRTCLAIEATSFQLCSGGVCGKVLEKDFGMIFEYFAKKLFSYDDKEGLKKLRANYKAFLNGLILFPLNIPGTAYYACMQPLLAGFGVIVILALLSSCLCGLLWVLGAQFSSLGCCVVRSSCQFLSSSKGQETLLVAAIAPLMSVILSTLIVFLTSL